MVAVVGRFPPPPPPPHSSCSIAAAARGGPKHWYRPNCYHFSYVTEPIDLEEVSTEPIDFEGVSTEPIDLNLLVYYKL